MIPRRPRAARKAAWGGQHCLQIRRAGHIPLVRSSSLAVWLGTLGHNLLLDRELVVTREGGRRLVPGGGGRSALGVGLLRFAIKDRRDVHGPAAGVLPLVDRVHQGGLVQILIQDPTSRACRLLALEVVPADVSPHLHVLEVALQSLIRDLFLAIFEPCVAIIDGILREGVLEDTPEAGLAGSLPAPGALRFLDLADLKQDHEC